jgi:lysophospholipase L1-like esterase
VIVAVLMAMVAGSGLIHPENLNKVQKKLSRLASATDSQSVVTIFQIGDSHLQAGFLSGRFRQNFQKKFGDAGRGFVFPHHVAGSNGAYDVRWQSNGQWASSNGIRKVPAFAFGMAGWSIQSLDSSSNLEMRLAPSDGVVDSFNSVRVFGDSSLIVGDSTGPWIFTNCGRDCRKATAPISSNRLKVQASAPGEWLDGLVLESGRRGVLWNESGVNGLAWSDLLKPTRMWRQLEALKPDLMVISLGTNDAWYNGYDANVFHDQVIEVLRRIRLVLPASEVLLTLPPDHALTVKKKKTAANPKLTSVLEIMRGICDSTGVTCSDLHLLMGGEGSWKTWTAQGLMAKDHVHYSKGGYIRQADLMSAELLEWFDSCGIDSAAIREMPKNLHEEEARQFLLGQDEALRNATWGQAKKVEIKPAKVKKKTNARKSRKSTRNRHKRKRR